LNDKDSSKAAYLFMAFSAMLAIYLVNNLMEHYKKFSTEFLVFFILFAISGMTSFLVNFSGLEKILGLFVFILSFATFQASPLKKYEINEIYYLFIITVFIMLPNGSTGGNVVVGKFNPNACGLLLTMLFCVSVVRFAHKKNLFTFIMIVVSFALQFVYDSRTALFGCLLFLLLFLIFRSWKNSCSSKNAFWIIAILSFLGLFAAYLYAEVLFQLIGKGKIIILGKDLFTGRQEIWHYAFQSINENFLFGVGSYLNNEMVQSTGRKVLSNAHNQPLGMFATFGFFPFVFFYLSLAAIIANFYHSKNKKRIYKKNRGYKYSSTITIFLFVVTVITYFEMSLFEEYAWLPILIAAGLIANMSKVTYKKSMRKNKKGIRKYKKIR
jgi:O-antigen ligase